MSFCYFSKDFTANAYTDVENKFIVKYMPQADGNAVKVYLYGLFLCQSPAKDFSLKNCAEALSLPEEKIIEAFEFWEDCDLVQIICRDPFTLEYLPVTATSGRPKKIKYEKYADFNKELQKKMQAAHKFLNYSELQKYMNFLQEHDMEPQAFLLVVEYCVRLSGDGVSHAQIFNKAKNFVSRGFYTYSQVEKALSDFNVHTADLRKTMSLLGIFRDPAEADYELYEKWSKAGFETGAVTEAARSMKRGTMQGLNALMEELRGKSAFTAAEAKNYLAEREILNNATFKIARSLGLKIASPLVYSEEYTAKWYARGYEEPSLCMLALFCVKTERNSFSELDGLLEKLYADGIVSEESVKDYVARMNEELKLLTKIGKYCGTIRKTEGNVETLSVWRRWNFSDEMIVEAAKRAANTARPLAYMNKILSDWKREEIFSVSAIPTEEKRASAGATTPTKVFVNPAVIAADERAERDRYYSALREKAQSVAERFERRAEKNPQFKQISAQLSQAERDAAKAEIFHAETLPALLQSVETLKAERARILTEMGITEDDFLPKYRCKKCSDSGFLPDGKACDCYPKKI